jgi:hypothetical protein
MTKRWQNKKGKPGRLAGEDGDNSGKLFFWRIAPKKLPV